MTSLSDSEVTVRRRDETQHRPRLFLRRGAVTELADPSAGRPFLQGVPADWVLSVPKQRRPSAPPDMNRMPSRPVPRPLARLRTAASSALVASLVLVLAAGVWWLLHGASWPRLSAVIRRITRSDAGTAPDRPSWTSALYQPWMSEVIPVGAVIVRTSMSTFGGQRLIMSGARSLLSLVPTDSLPRRVFDDETVANRLAVAAFALFPTAASAALACVIPQGFCNPEHNARRFLPARTRDDIKHALEAWFGLAQVHAKAGMSLWQMGRWGFTAGRALAWVFGIAVWATVEIVAGPCWYVPRAWRAWSSVLCLSLASWLAGNATSLLVDRWSLVGKAHAQLLLFIGAIYFAGQVDPNGFCVKPSCW